MSDLKDRIQQDLNKARKGRDKPRTLVLSTLLSDLRNREIDQGSEADDDTVQEIVIRGIKQRRDAAEQMRQGGRPELAEKEEQEAELLTGYLPEQLSADDVREIIREIVAGGTSDMGPVMGQLMPRIKGRFDGKQANALVREVLQG